MKYILTAVLTACCFAGTTESQINKRKASEKCKIDIKEAPKLGGYFLGQERSDLPFRRIVVSGRQLDLLGTRIEGVVDPAKATVRDSAFSVSWRLNKEKVVALDLMYLGYTPKDLSQLIQDYSALANLPEGIFKITSEHDAEAKCGGFSLFLTDAYRDSERMRPRALVRIVDRINGTVDDGRRIFESRTDAANRQREELRRNPRKIINPGGPTVGP